MTIVDDILYIGSLFVCVSVGHYYRKIENPVVKKNYGAGLGFLVTFLIYRQYIVYSLLMLWGNILVLRCAEKRHVHQLSLFFTWLYTGFLYLYMRDKFYIMWMHQNMALRLVGLAFEINMSHRDKIGKVTNEELDPSASDIISYAYFYIGIHRGPYYRWKVYNDHFNQSIATLSDCRVVTEQKLKKALVCFLIYAVLNAKYSTDMYYRDSFYKDHNSDYRYLYNIPQLVMYLLQYQIFMMLATSVCTEAGFGVYPTKCNSLPGFGPTAHMSMSKLANIDPETALNQEYNFAMLKCYDNEKLIFGPKMKDTIRGWNMPTRYWFWAYIYKGFIKGNKQVRSMCSFAAWMIWAGPDLRHLLLTSTLWVYVNLEDEYGDLYDTSGPMKSSWDFGFSIMRSFCLIYLTPCLIIQDCKTLFRYYNSIYWAFHLILITLLFSAILIYKGRR